MATGQPAVAVGISPVTYNATLYYDNGPASIRLSFVTTTSRSLRAPTRKASPAARFWTDATNQLDLSASYKFESLPSQPQITLNVINITGETQRQTWGNDSHRSSRTPPARSTIRVMPCCLESAERSDPVDNV